MRKNKEKDLCANCNKEIGDIPIFDDNGEYWICEKCDNELFNDCDDEDYTFIVQAIDTQIEYHKKENNISAVRSLEYVKEVINGKTESD